MNDELKNALLIVCLFISGFAFGQKKQMVPTQRMFDSAKNESRRRVIGKPLPSFVATDGNDVIASENLKGKVLFINLWELHCAPCIAEIPILNELYEKLKDKKNFEFVSLTFESLDAIKEMKREYHIQYKIYQISRDNCYKVNGQSGFPASLIYNSQGIGKHIYMGGNTDTTVVKKFVLYDSIYPAIIRELYTKQ